MSPAASGSRTPGEGGLNTGYVCTISGLLQVGQTVALLVSFLCVRCVRGWPNWAAFQMFEVVLIWFLVVLLVFITMHLFRLEAKMNCINWPMTEFFHYSIGTLLVFIGSIVAAVYCGGVSALVVASVFGFLATFLMAISVWTSYSVSLGAHQTGAAM
ncbi:CKLF-like MARVEL transmembrane domain-containing protein 7 [Antennarius striatus]|uniref:CKLF-like MARVEL transmembrane domain-containing protein 7 n=1 Tax=Antennarius striatus TaxID=241820 RepID=UPI0035ADD657